MNYKEIIEKEGNYKEWIYTAQNGVSYKCFIRRNMNHLFLCGYVEITNDNKLFGEDYSNLNFHAHGGITYGSQAEDVWIYGFDCAHFSDMMLDLEYRKSREGIYRTMDYVTEECELLAEQFSKFSISGERSQKLEELIRS